MHKLLARQLQHYFGSLNAPPEDWAAFADAVSSAYEQTDADRLLLERSLELTSHELLARQRQLQADVADRERAEQEIARSLSLLRATLDSTRDGILVVDRDGQVIELNQRLLDMWHMPADVIAGRDVAAATAFLADQIRDPFVVSFEGQGLQREGATDDVLELADGRIFERHSQPQWIAEESVGRVWSFRDVTAERRRAEEILRESEDRLRQSQKMEAIGQLAGGVAHDFNNLLTAINGFSELVLTRMEQADELRPLVEEIAKAGERASALTSQLLAFGRRQVLQPKVLSVTTVVADMDKLLRRLIGEDIELTTVVDPELGNVRADPGQLGQVLLNLATNARDAMPRGGRLTIEAVNMTLDHHQAAKHNLKSGRCILVRVSDTGLGIDDAVLPHIFEPFFTTKEVGKGTGLGLSTVYGIVKQSGGELEVSTIAGQGTTFSIYLPRYEESPETAEAVSLPRLVTTGKETLLIAEDEDPVRSLVTAVLEATGHKVLAARRGEEALRICSQFDGQIHLLLTDIVMPGMSGLELSDRVLALRPGTRVLYMSGHTNDVTLRHGVLTANAAFLQKPFTPSALALKVREVLDAAPATARPSPS